MGEMDEFVMSGIEFDFYKRNNIKLSDIDRIDVKTPFYRDKMNELPLQQRMIVASLSRHGKPARICEIANISRLWQQNKTSSQVGRLVRKGILEKQKNENYWLSSEDPDFIKYLDMRLNGRFN